MKNNENFFNLYNHNFVRVGIAVPEVKVADPAFNCDQVVALMEQAAERRTLVLVFPELTLSAYSCEDLFHQEALLTTCLDALAEILERTREIPVVAIVGLPLKLENRLYNCAAVIFQGRILGVVPKIYLPNYAEFYEARQFVSGDTSLIDHIDLCGQADIPFGQLLFQVEQQPLLTFSIEICEDLWVPVPPSCYAALAGAILLLNPSGSNITIGKAEYRRQLVGNQSGRCIAAYVYASAGSGESTTDLAWDGHGMIYENGSRLAETERFHYGPQLITSEIDLERLSQDRMRQNTFSQSVQKHKHQLQTYRTIKFFIELPREEKILLHRRYERFPYVPSDPVMRDQRCTEVYEIQVQGLVKRLKATSFKNLVIGVSGGLDSTHALLVCAQVMDVLGLPRSHILAYTMPGFGTSERTLTQAHRLMAALGCSTREVDIRPSCQQMLKDIGHPAAEGKPVYDTTYENVQAGQRSSLLFRIANVHRAMVVGTSDLSELGLGWCTYGIGDHMAHYHVNASVPKTLIQYLIRWVADTARFGENVSEVLYDVLNTEISPELTPGKEGEEQPAQRSEEAVGPYELQDFHLYYILRFGYPPPKVAFLAYCAWHDVKLGNWPELPPEKRHAYTIKQIKHWLGVFLNRFFRISQYKRSAIPNAPKVGSGGSLSPRGDYRAPSDSDATVWLKELKGIPEDEG
jgi:NAD+ synthase (glutamine-hydrolysing)